MIVEVASVTTNELNFATTNAPFTKPIAAPTTRATNAAAGHGIPGLAGQPRERIPGSASPLWRDRKHQQ